MIISIFAYLFLLVIILGVLVFSGYMVYAMFVGAPFVPTSRARVRSMLKLAGLKPREKFVDFGSGDGRLVFAASVFGGECVGVELSPMLVFWSRLKSRFKKNSSITFVCQDMWSYDLSDTDVLALYCIDHKMKKMADKIKSEMRPGSRVVSNGFTFPNWQYLQKDGKVYLYVV